MTWTDVITTPPRKPQQARADEPGRRELHVYAGPDAMSPTGLSLYWEPEPQHSVLSAEICSATAGREDGRLSRVLAVALATEVCERHGWLLKDLWTDEHGELHTRLEKEER